MSLFSFKCLTDRTLEKWENTFLLILHMQMHFQQPHQLFFPTNSSYSEIISQF